MTRRLTNRRTLDLWTPDNPVLMRPGLRGNINSKALEVLNEFLPGYSASIQETMHGVDIGEDIPEIGWVGSQEMAVITWELFLRNLDPNTLAQMLKLQSESWAALGVTTWGTRIPFPKVMTGYASYTDARACCRALEMSTCGLMEWLQNGGIPTTRRPVRDPIPKPPLI